jgi:hypothetical protein
MTRAQDGHLGPVADPWAVAARRTRLAEVDARPTFRGTVFAYSAGEPPSRLPFPT